ncbi:MAG TPA: T9SS type A sorting domain-containing protein [Flavisolibacter sp.]|nr:T9SS type A sorting domain-containing protein [Flavisolibacter sp.]
MKRILFITLLTVWAGGAGAQLVTTAVLNSSEARGSVNNISFEFNLGEMATTTIGSGLILTQGLLQPMSLASNGPLPVIGLEFNAKRTSRQHVQLDWKTIQEIGNKGFLIERKKENESGFAAIRFVNSRAMNGNSDLPLQYAATDTNTYSDKTYYRLKQEDIDGRFAYSTVRLVQGEASAMALKAWPIPAPREFWVSLESSTRDELLIYDALGKAVRQMALMPGQAVKIAGLPAGTYTLVLRANRDITQRVIVQ